MRILNAKPFAFRLTNTFLVLIEHVRLLAVDAVTYVRFIFQNVAYGSGIPQGRFHKFLQIAHISYS